jgi:hypothetical protein
MSLSKLSWSHIGPHHPFPEKQKFHGCYQDALDPSAFLRPLGLSISAAFAPGPPAMSNSSNMNALSPDEMQRFQKLSNEFQPDVPVGDPVGDCVGKGEAKYGRRGYWSRRNNQVTTLPWTMPMRIPRSLQKHP